MMWFASKEAAVVKDQMSGFSAGFSGALHGYAKRVACDPCTGNALDSRFGSGRYGFDFDRRGRRGFSQNNALGPSLFALTGVAHCA